MPSTSSIILLQGVQSLRERRQPPRMFIWGTAGIGAGGHLLPPGVSQEFGGREHEGTLPQTPNRRATEVVGLEGSNVQNTQLVAGANHSPWGG